MYFKYDSNWKEVYMANSSPLFETLHAAYFLAFNIWPWLEGHPDCLSDSVIKKTDNSQQMSYYVWRILYAIYS